MENINRFNSSEKIMQYPEKLNIFFNANKTLIVTEIDLTNECNNKCPCCTGINQNKDSLTWGEIQQIIGDLKKLDNKGIILSGGGEPLMHPRFVDALELIKRTGMQVGLNSNGLALTEEKSLAIFDACKYFRISLDAGTPEMYKQTHGMPAKAFEKVIDNIRMAVEVRRKLGSSTSFGVGFLTGPDTISDMESFVSLIKGTGADFAQFRPFTGDRTDISEKIDELRSKYETDGFKITASTQKYSAFAEESRGYDKCRGMFFSTVITANARMYACLHHRQNPDFFIGDMREGKTLLEVWNSWRKYYVYQTMNVENCPIFCRNDSFNKTLGLLDMDVAHSEFL